MPHTPGPWHVHEYGHPIIFDSGRLMTAKCDNPLRPKPENSANARLIAAAPELLEACREALLQIEYLHDKFKATGSGNGVLARLEATIANATTG